MSFRKRFREYEDVSLKDANKLRRTYDRGLFIFSISFAVIICSLIFIKFSDLESNRSEIETMAKKMKDKNLKIAVIARGGENLFLYEYFSGALKESESMGVKIRTLGADYDLANFRNLLVQAGKNYDGVIVHGGNDEIIEEIKKIVNIGIPIVAFDSTSELSKIKGITMTSENDKLMLKCALEICLHN